MSSQYNQQMNDKVNAWIRRLSKNGKLVFQLGNAILEFNTARMKFSGVGAIDKCYHAKEPELVFDYEDNNKSAINQLKGLVNYGPIESYANKSIRLAILFPRE